MIFNAFSNVGISDYICQRKSYMMKPVDTRGLKCPAPLIKTRQALNEAEEGEALQIIIDNPSSLGNIKRFLNDNKLGFSEKSENGITILIVNRGGQLPSMDNVEDYCSVTEEKQGRKVVVAITSERMGSGDDELGTKLMSSFFKVLPLTEPLPYAIVIYNAGVKLAVAGSPVEEYLKELETKGVRIYMCVTCVDYFNIKEKINVGIISDMYQIINVLNEASLVLRP